MALKPRRSPIVSGREELVGAPWEKCLKMPPGGGMARIHSELWSVRSAQSLVRRESALDGIDRLILQVTSAEKESKERFMFANFGFGTLFVMLLVVLFSAFRILREYECGVVFMLRRFHEVKDPASS